MDRQTRRNPSQWQQPSPALVPQQSHAAPSPPSPILAPRSLSPTQMTPPNDSNSNDWKQSPWNNEPSSPPNEGSTSQKDAAITLDNSKFVSSKVVENDVSS